MGYDPDVGRKGTGTERSATNKGGRFWEVDAARGVAILMMVAYHFVYDLYAFGGYDVDAVGGFWARFADTTASLFLFLVGVSLAIGHAGGGGGFRRYLLRGLRILAYGMVLTAVFLVFGMGIVAFGILHLIGVSVILAYPLLGLRYANLALGVAVFGAGLYLQAGDPTGSAWLLPFGVVPEGWAMPDYRPLLPWFGVVLVGLFFGNVVYGGGRPAGLPAPPTVARPLLPLGRNSLAIYLVHQPVMVVLLAALGVVDLGLF